MLEKFDQSFQGFIPAKDPKGPETPEKIRDIDGASLNSLEKKMLAIWEDPKIDHSAKYKKIFYIFFEEFCKRNKDENIQSSTGNWIQSTLERLGIMGIPIGTLLRETSTLLTQEDFSNLRSIFNKEIAQRERGATAVIKYVDESKRQRPGTRLLTNGLLDREYSIDLIEASGFTERSTQLLCLTQVKAGKIERSEIEQIHAKHIEYFEYMKKTEIKYSETQKTQIEEQIEKEKDELMKKMEETNEDIQFEIAILLEERPELDYEKVIEIYAEKKNMTTKEIWLELYYLAQDDNNKGLVFLPEFSVILDHAKNMEMKDREETDFEKYIITAQRSNRICSRVVCEGRVVSEIILK